MNLPSKILEIAVDEIASLPGIGKKSAMRLALHLLKQDPQCAISLSKALQDLVTEISYCKNCYNFSDQEICQICENPNRNSQLLCVVEDVRDVIAIENTHQFHGKYMVLGGKLSPMEGIGPKDLHIDALENKLQEAKITEVIFALSATIEGDTTAYYLYKKFRNYPINFSTIARGISVGDELEYADEISLGRSILNRIPYCEK